MLGYLFQKSLHLLFEAGLLHLLIRAYAAIYRYANRPDRTETLYSLLLMGACIYFFNGGSAHNILLLQLIVNSLGEYCGQTDFRPE